MITLRFLGGEAVSYTRLLDEPALLGLFDWPGVAHPATFSRRLQGFDYRHNLGLQALARQFSRRTQASGAKLYAVDSTVVTVHGHQVQGAEVGYNPHKPDLLIARVGQFSIGQMGHFSTGVDNSIPLK